MNRMCECIGVTGCRHRGLCPELAARSDALCAACGNRRDLAVGLTVLTTRRDFDSHAAEACRMSIEEVDQ